MPRRSSLQRFLFAVKMSSAKNVYMFPLWLCNSCRTRSIECVRHAWPYMPGTEQNVHENGHPREVAPEMRPPGFQPAMGCESGNGSTPRVGARGRSVLLAT